MNSQQKMILFGALAGVAVIVAVIMGIKQFTTPGISSTEQNSGKEAMMKAMKRQYSGENVPRRGGPPPGAYNQNPGMPNGNR